MFVAGQCFSLPQYRASPAAAGAAAAAATSAAAAATAAAAAGTGIVHCAPAFGEDDYRVCIANK